MTTTLLLIDIQNDYFPGGSMELVGSPQAGARAGKLLHAFRQKSLPIIRKRSIDIAIDDGGSDDVEAKPNGDSPPNTRAGALRSRRRFGQWGVCQRG
jgi:nicotinamidase-related amidase